MGFGVAGWLWLLALLAPMVAEAGPDGIPQGKFLVWDARKDAARHSYGAGGVVVTFVSKSAKKDDGGETDAEATVAYHGVRIVVPFQGGFDHPQTDFAVGKLDPASDVPSVILAPYTGGAHCCTERRVVVFHGGKWRVFAPQAGFNQDVNEFPKDENGDGAPDVVLRDDRFAYTFGCFACSWLPPMVFAVRDGALIDVSNSRRYDRLYEDDAAAAQKACADKNSSPNGACAGYAADGARLGTFRKAWAFVMAHYDAKDRWTLPDGCKADIAVGRCPKGEAFAYETYPRALAGFLRQAGYIAREEERWAVRQSH